MNGDASYLETAKRHRGEFAERKTATLLKSVFGNHGVFERVKVKKGKKETVTDIDVLALAGNRAVIAQVKSKRLTELAKMGDDRTLAADFQSAIQGAYDQGLRKHTDPTTSACSGLGLIIESTASSVIYFFRMSLAVPYCQKHCDGIECRAPRAPTTYRTQNIETGDADSQWEIPEEDENVSFLQSWTKGWCFDGKGWGFHVVLSCPVKLGVTEAPVEDSFIAKFVSSAEPIKWHGYPADRRKNQDIPPRQLLKVWRKENLLKPAKISKIGKGKRCKL